VGSPARANGRLGKASVLDPVRAERALEEDLEGGVHRATVLEEPDRAVQVDRLVEADEERVVRVVAGLEQAVDPPLGDALALVVREELELGRWVWTLVDAPMCIANLLLPCTDALSADFDSVNAA
jgi:hypothetical protein